MTGPSTPGQEGPSYGPPQLPEGWIAQWDGHSRKYYFVQLSTGQSTWETPTHAAPTGPTPQATPQGVDHPHGLPSDGTLINNADGSQSVRYADGRVEPIGGESDRGLGSFAMNQLLNNKKQSNQSSSGVMGLASQFLGGNSHNQTSGHSSSSGTSGIVGALAGSLLGGGKKQNHQQTNYSGAQTQQGQGSSGLMGSLGGMFGGHSGGSSGGNNYGYSTNNSHQGGYSGTAPPSSYQPSGASSYDPSRAQQQQQQQQSYNQPSYGTPTNAQQPPYGGHPQQPPYGGIQHHDSYGPGAPPQHHQYPPPPNYGGQPQHTGNLQQPQHHHFQGMHNAEHSGGLYGNGGQHPPPPPMNSHPYGGQQQGGRGW